MVVWDTWEINSGPLSDCKEVGTPKWGMISDNTMVETVRAHLLVIGKASTQHENVSTSTRKYQ